MPTILHADAAGGLGHGEPGPAELDHLLPEPLVPARAARRARRRRRDPARRARAGARTGMCSSRKLAARRRAAAARLRRSRNRCGLPSLIVAPTSTSAGRARARPGCCAGSRSRRPRSCRRTSSCTRSASAPPSGAAASRWYSVECGARDLDAEPRDVPAATRSPVSLLCSGSAHRVVAERRDARAAQFWRMPFADDRAAARSRRA